MRLLDTARAWARRIKRDAMTLWFARRHPATPWYAKVMGAFVVAYALSPIDLIPDFIPVLGYLDDVILLPLLIWLTIRLLPQAVLDSARRQAEQWFRQQRPKPSSRAAALAICGLWATALIAITMWAIKALAP